MSNCSHRSSMSHGSRFAATHVKEVKLIGGSTNGVGKEQEIALQPRN